MNIILRRTHLKANIELLKARDYYFNFAKRLNLAKTIIVLLPPIFLLTTYILTLLGLPSVFKGYDEIFIATLTTIAGFIIHLFDFTIQKYVSISNHLRALYDHNVLGVKYNPHIYQAKAINETKKMSKRVGYYPKYEVWYSEVFSDNHNANVFCCQIDNLLYAKHAYRKAKQFYIWQIALLSVFVLAAITFSIIQKEYLIAILVMFSAFECYDVFFGKIGDLDNALALCTEFCDYAKTLSVDSIDEDVLEKTQEIISRNRELCIFLPRVIREWLLEDDNPFYKELNNYKNVFMGKHAYIPETADDIDVVYEDGSASITLRQIQNRLSVMLKEVVQLFEKHGIDYTLDGGTLIGAMRKSANGFIPWDDDVDIAIPLHQIEMAKKVIREHLDYVIQDAENEKFYSSRLSSFKIREKNTYSMISEKDSMLYDHYQNKGLFIDVYAFSPILISKPIDKLFRRVLIHPLNQRLEKIENQNPKGIPFSLQQKRFFKAKKRHIRLLNFYKKYAKNTKWYAYFPGYIYNLSKAGPYHSWDELYRNNVRVDFGKEVVCRIPSNADAILTAYYGKDWRIPPFKGKEELVAEHGNSWFSKAPTKITVLKHIANIISFSKINK